MKRPNVERLKRIRAAHDLRADGVGTRVIAAQLNASRDTIQVYLAMPCPTDAEIEAAAVIIPRCPHSGPMPSLRVKLDPTTADAFALEAANQGCSQSQLGDLAVRLYLDCVRRLRNGTSEPVPLRGYIPMEPTSAT